MQELQLPTSHDWTAQDRVYGKLTMGPFEPGFALTVGNAYRRVLLSAIHGAAPTYVKIENVLHEFSHLPGVVEDTLDIMMNLRERDRCGRSRARRRASARHPSPARDAPVPAHPRSASRDAVR